MKRLKKMIAVVLAVMVAMAFGSVSVFAHTISVQDTDTHEYKVFQVLTGTLSENGSNKLGDPAWGADATDAAKETNVNAFITTITAPDISKQDIAQLVAEKVDTSKAGQGTVKKGSPLADLATGYYVLVDVTTLEKYGSNPEKIDTKALNVVRVVNDINGIEIKWGTTEDKKTIVSDTLGKDDSAVNNVNGAKDNVSVGDTVNYKIEAKVPANANRYNYFYFVINDTLDNGLTFSDNVKVYKGSVAQENLLTLGADKDYQLKKDPDADGKTFQVALNDAKSLADQTIIVTYSAVLNENAKIGEDPNKNTSTVKFSNDPNHDYDGEHNPGFPASTEDSAMGETPVTETETYTTGIEIQKVDQDGKVLTGATFELSGQSTKKVLTVAETFTKDNEKGTYYKLKDGTYTKTAPTTEGEYMVKTAGATAGYVVDASYDGDDKKVVDGTTYRPYAPDTDNGKDVYVLHTGNGHLYDGTDKYTKSTSKTVSDATSSHKATQAVDENGLARFDGLGAGTYTIKETVTPSGYNTLGDMNVTVSFSANGTPKWSFSGGNGSYDSQEGIYKIKIENQQGTELPSTGGMGTTIFYILGAILIVGAGIVLAARRRMGANN